MLSDHATWPPWAGVIGSRPCLPVFASLNLALLPLVISENTHRIWLVSLPQAKLTCAGSDATLGFLQAVSIWLCTLATISTPLRDFGILGLAAAPRPALRRPRSMSACVRCWADAPGQPAVLMAVVSASGSSSSMA